MKKTILALLFLFLMASAALSQNQTISQETFLLSRIQQFPNSALLRDELGELYLSQLNFGKAVQEFKTAVSLDPSDARGRYNLGLAYELSGSYLEAREAYEDAASWSSYGLNFRLGICYHKLGDDQKAVLCYRKVEALRSTAGVHYALAQSLADLGSYPEAIQELESARNLDPDFKAGKEYFFTRQLMEQSKEKWKEETGRKISTRIIAGLGIPAALVVLYLAGKFFLRKRMLCAEEDF